MPVSYIEPRFHGFEEVFASGKFVPEYLELIGVPGDFVFSGNGQGELAAFSLEGPYGHQAVAEKFQLPKISILGGGRIYVCTGKQLKIQGFSQTYGSLPNNMVRDYFTHFGYHVDGRLVEKDLVSEKTLEWVRAHK